jgi:hypothetical protein
MNAGTDSGKTPEISNNLLLSDFNANATMSHENIEKRIV